MNNYKSITSNWQPVIGVEIHVQLQTETKMFSPCKWQYGEPPNTLTCPVTMAYPGTLPIINKKAVNSAIMIGHALNCKINRYSEFSRKHYFYPDLPKGYQISQFDKPICGKGNLNVEFNNKNYNIAITRAHLEEDAGKLIHSLENTSLVDYNRSGAPLIEIVTEPDFRQPEVVIAFLKALKNTIEYIGVSDCDMEKGNLRVDLNVSIMKKDDLEFGIRREIKNLNSFRSVNKAIQYEVVEQAKILESGNKVKQSTMIWNENKNKTIVTRKKEDAHDYRYFPEPDLPPLIISDDEIRIILESMPELPREKSLRFKEEFNLNDYDIEFLISDKSIATYFENTLDYTTDTIQVLNWLKTHIMQVLNREKISICDFPIKPERLCQLLDLLNQQKITNDNAKKVFDVMLSNQKSPVDIISNMNLEILTDSKELSEIIKEVFNKNSNEYNRLKNGEDKLVKFFMGQVMRETKGKYPPYIIIKTLKDNI